MNPTTTQSGLIDSLIRFSEGQGLNTEHTAVLESLKHAGFPSNKNEEYRFTPITRALEKAFSGKVINASSASKQDVTQPLLDGCIRIIIRNGEVLIPGSALLPEGLKIYKSGYTPAPSTDAFENAVNLLCGEKVIIEATSDIEQIILLDHQISTSENPDWINNSIELIVKKNSKLFVAEHWSYSNPVFVFSNQTLYGSVAEQGELNYFRFQTAEGNLNQVYNSVITQAGSSQVNAFTLTTNGGIIRNNFSVVIDGERAEANLLGLYLINGNTLADNHTVVDHRKPNSNSNELFKGVISGNAKAVFNGKIFVRPDAQKTNAFQSNRNIVLSDNASVNTKPQLEIWADDVKCSHGCTTGQLAEDAIFYLQARGIDKQAAQALLIDAFAGEVTDKITNEGLKEIARRIASEKIESLK